LTLIFEGGVIGCDRISAFTSNAERLLVFRFIAGKPDIEQSASKKPDLWIHALLLTGPFSSTATDPTAINANVN